MENSTCLVKKGLIFVENLQLRKFSCYNHTIFENMKGPHDTIFMSGSGRMAFHTMIAGQPWHTGLIRGREFDTSFQTPYWCSFAGQELCGTQRCQFILAKGVDMELKVDYRDGIDSWKEVTLIYSAALRQIETKLEILNDEFQHVHLYNPIEHIKSRIKTPESIVKKLKRGGYESTIDNMIKYVNDIAGIRIICSFTSDIYRLAEMIGTQKDIRVISVKDYIKNPKPRGYKSYHMIISLPIYLSEEKVDVKVEIQIRTVAMDFWASLEHKIHYKFEGDAPEYIRNELVECAKMVTDLDARMLKLNDEVSAISRERNM